MAVAAAGGAAVGMVGARALNGRRRSVYDDGSSSDDDGEVVVPKVCVLTVCDYLLYICYALSRVGRCPACTG